MEEELQKWISGLSRDKLESIAFEVIDQMIDTDDLHYRPNADDSPKAPYWPGSGVELGEDEE